MLFLEKCSSLIISDEEKSKLPKWILILFLTLNVTNTYQPSGMCMITIIKVGYKVTLLEQILSSFDIERVYLGSYTEMRIQNRVFKGIYFDGKTHSLDSMRVLKHI